MKRKSLKSLFCILFISLIAFTSCSNLLQNELEEKATLKISLDEANARNVLPDVDLSTFTDFILTGSLNGTSKEIGKWDSYSKLSTASLTIDPGKWTFTLTAKKGTATFSGTSTVTVEAGKTATASFVLVNQASGNGSVNVSLQYPKTSGIKGAILLVALQSDSATVDDTHAIFSNSEDVNFTDTAISFTKALKPGNYLFQVEFYSDAIQNIEPGSRDKWIGIYVNYFVVEPGLETKAEFDVSYINNKIPVIEPAESIANGIQFNLDVPANTTNVSVRRREITNPSKASEPASWWIWGATEVCCVKNNSDEGITRTVKDRYGIEAGKTYQYGMIVNYDKVADQTIAVTAENNGFAQPAFTSPIKAKFDSKTESFICTQTPELEFPNNESYDYEIQSRYIKWESGNWKYDFGWYPTYFSKYPTKLSVQYPEDLPREITLKLQSTQLSFNEEGVQYLFSYSTDAFDLPKEICVTDSIKETENGIEIQIPVYEGTKNIDIERSSDYGKTFTLIGGKYYGNDNPCEEAKTLTFIDKYGYSENNTYKYRVKYDWSDYKENKEGISFIPTSNGAQTPTVEVLDVTKSEGEEGIRCSLKSIQELFGDEEGFRLQFVYKVGEKTQYIDWKKETESFTVEKSAVLEKAILVQDYENEGESFSHIWNIPSEKLVNLPSYVPPKPSIKSYPEATFETGILTFTSKGAVNVEGTDYVSSINQFTYYYKDSADNILKMIVMPSDNVTSGTVMVWHADNMSMPVTYGTGESIDFNKESLKGKTYTLNSALMHMEGGKTSTDDDYDIPFTPDGDKFPLTLSIPE